MRFGYFDDEAREYGITRPEIEGLRVDPCIPSTWAGFKATPRLRDRIIRIDVENPGGVCRGVETLILNGEPLAGNLIPADRPGAHNQATVILGQGSKAQSFCGLSF